MYTTYTIILYTIRYTLYTFFVPGAAAAAATAAAQAAKEQQAQQSRPSIKGKVTQHKEDTKCASGASHGQPAPVANNTVARHEVITHNFSSQGSAGDGSGNSRQEAAVGAPPGVSQKRLGCNRKNSGVTAAAAATAGDINAQRKVNHIPRVERETSDANSTAQQDSLALPDVEHCSNVGC